MVMQANLGNQDSTQVRLAYVAHELPLLPAKVLCTICSIIPIVLLYWLAVFGDIFVSPLNS